MGVFDIFSSSSGKRAAAAADQARVSGLRAGEERATGYLNDGLNSATSQYNKASDLFNQWYNTGQSANAMYGNALGLNGADGNAAAVSAFQTSPGYQFSVDQATEAAKRNASSLGMLGSGNTMMAISDRSQNLANQEYQNWLNNLNTASSSGQSAAGSQAGIQTGLGDLQYGNSAALASLAHGTETQVGASAAQRIADTQAAKQAASGNIWGAILGVGDLAARFYGASKTPGVT